MNLLNLVKHASGSAGSAIGLVPQYFVRGVQLLDANGPRPFLRARMVGYARLRQTNKSSRGTWMFGASTTVVK